MGMKKDVMIYLSKCSRSSFSRKKKKLRKRMDDFHHRDKRQEESICRHYSKLSGKKRP